MEKPETLLSAYELINRIRLSGSDTVLVEAEDGLRWITEQYFSPNLSVEEMRTLVRSAGSDPLKRFGEAHTWQSLNCNRRRGPFDRRDLCDIESDCRGLT